MLSYYAALWGFKKYISPNDIELIIKKNITIVEKPNKQECSSRRRRRRSKYVILTMFYKGSFEARVNYLTLWEY